MKIISSFILIAAFCAHSIAQQTIQEIQDKKIIVMGTSGQQDPFSFKDENDSLIGIDIEIARSLASGMNVELEIVEIPFPNLLKELQEGNVDFVMSGLSMKIERNMQVAMAGPYFKTEKAILTNNVNLKKATRDDINMGRVKLVVVENSTSEVMAKLNFPEASLTKVNTIDEGIALVEQKEADALVADFEVCAQGAMTHDGLEVLQVKDVTSYDPLGIAVRNDDFLFLNLLENYIDAVIASGYRDYLVEKYYGID